METKSIRGRICYKDNCSRCNKSRGYVRKEGLDKRCRSCASYESSIGRSSPLKGKKTGKPAHNRGKYYSNPLKKILKNRMSRRMRHALSGRNLSKNWVHIFELMGYTVEDLKIHLESKFTQGMTWENIGEWHIDHIIPESYFNYKSVNDDDFKKCWSLENLQPLWAKDNIMKSNKIVGGVSFLSQ